MGLERVLLALADEGIEPPSEPGLAVYVVDIGAGREAAHGLVGTLRRAGISTDAAFQERPLKAQLKAADRAGAAYAAIVGEREVGAGIATLRRLSDGEQMEVALDDVVNWLARELGKDPT
jgi:histidyl-tRNA synthetase